MRSFYTILKDKANGDPYLEMKAEAVTLLLENLFKLPLKDYKKNYCLDEDEDYNLDQDRFGYKGVNHERVN